MLHLDEARGRSFRESFYFHFFDPARPLAATLTLAFRPAARSGDAVLVVVDEERVLVAWRRGWPAAGESRVALGGLVLEQTAPGPRVAGRDGGPWRMRFCGRLGVHARSAFPPAPLGLLFPRRQAEAALELEFAPRTPLLDYRPLIPPGWLERLRPLGLDHHEQLGRYRGELRLDGGPALALDGRGNRDHSWGERDWRWPDGWTNHAAQFDDGEWVHALRIRVGGEAVAAGFVGRDEAFEPVVDVRHERLADGGFRLDVTGRSGQVLSLEGRRRLGVTVPILISRRPLDHLRGRPWAASIEQGAAAYRRRDGAVGYGLDERLENRPEVAP